MSFRESGPAGIEEASLTASETEQKLDSDINSYPSEAQAEEKTQPSEAEIDAFLKQVGAGDWTSKSLEEKTVEYNAQKVAYDIAHAYDELAPMQQQEAPETAAAESAPSEEAVSAETSSEKADLPLTEPVADAASADLDLQPAPVPAPEAPANPDREQPVLEAKTPGRIFFPSLSELKGVMKGKLTSKENHEWADIEAAREELRASGVIFSDGLNLTASENLANARKLQSVLKKFSPESYRNQRFVPINQKRTDAISYDPNLSEDQLFELLKGRGFAELKNGESESNSIEKPSADHDSLKREILEKLRRDDMPKFVTSAMEKILLAHGISEATIEKYKDDTEGLMAELKGEGPENRTPEKQVGLTQEELDELVKGESEPTLEMPAQPEQPESEKKETPDINALRLKYVEAKKALDKYNVLDKFRQHLPGKLKGDSLEKVKDAFSEARTEYLLARAEYVGANVLRHLEESKAMAESKMERYGRLDQSSLEKLRRGYMKLGEWNWNLVSKTESKAKKVAYKMLSVRSAITAALLLGAVPAAGAYRAASSFLGGWSAAEQFREARAHKDLTKDEMDGMDLVHIEDQLKRMEVYYGGYKGQTREELLKREDYSYLLSRKSEFLHDMSEAQRAELFREHAVLEEDAFDKALGREKSGRRKAMLYGGVGAMAMFNAGRIYDLLHEDTAVDAAASKGSDVYLSPEGREAAQEAAESGAAEEAEDAAVVHVGSRGIEGTILDLKKTNPEQYGKIMNWLHEQNPKSHAQDSSLVHRFVKKFADENGFELHGSGKNLSEISGADIRIGPDGRITIDSESVKFIEPSDAHQEAPESPQAPQAEASPEQAAADAPPDPEVEVVRVEDPETEYAAQKVSLGPENVEAETLNFEDMIPKSELAEAQKETAYESVARAFESQKKVTDALKTYLDKDYGPFMKQTLRMDARELNKIQALKVKDIVGQYDMMSPKMKKEYGGLVNAMRTTINSVAPEKKLLLNNESVRKFLMRLAVERRNEINV